MEYHCLFSGGIDSTAMIYRLLKSGHTVYAYYIKINNNISQTKRELSAVDRLSKKFKSEFESQYGGCTTVLDINVLFFKNTPMYPQIPLLLAALQYLPTTPRTPGIPRKSIRFAIGMSKTDPLDYREILRHKYNDSLRYYIEAPSKNKSFTIGPKLVFPISGITRYRLWNDLPDEYKLNVTWCESEHSDIPENVRNCGAYYENENYKPLWCSKCEDRKQMISEYLSLDVKFKPKRFIKSRKSKTILIDDKKRIDC